jgi:hypothetical protein
MNLDEIPRAAQPPADARPSAVVARLRAVRPSRRAVLRGLVVGAAAAALVPLDWYLSRRAAAAEPADRSEHLGCMPVSYDEEANNWPAAGAAVCFGGWRRGTYPCSDGFHREGSFADDEARFTSTRLTTNCHGRNAWRWQGWRCSDAMTTAVFPDGTDYTSITIAACAVDDSGEAVSDGAAEPADDEQDDDTATDDTATDDTATDDTATDDTATDDTATGAAAGDGRAADGGTGDGEDGPAVTDPPERVLLPSLLGA